MSERIDSIYYVDYTKTIGHYDSIRNFTSQEMTYIGLALSTPKIHVDSTPYSYNISDEGSTQIREYTISQLNTLQEISKELAVNSPKYILICYSNREKRYFKYNETFCALFKIAFQYRPPKEAEESPESPIALQNSNVPSVRTFENPPKVTDPSSTTTNTVNKKPLGMDWYKFLIYFSLIASAIINFIYSLAYISGEIYFVETNGQVSAHQVYAHYGKSLQVVDVIMGFFLIAFAILALVVRHKLANFRIDSLKFVKIFYSISACVPLLYTILVSVITGQSPAVQAIISVIINFALLLVNANYFKKRSHLFNNQAVPAQLSPSKAPLTIAVLSVFLFVSIIFNAVQLHKINEIDAQRRFAEKQVDNLLSNISDLEYQLRVNQNIADFVDEYVVFVEDDGTNFYHKFDCYRFVGNYFWVYNIDAVIGGDFSPCPYCH